uniref:Uncharacterized protein n=1 Tax=Siphoviridae sp. ctvod4 TaxID=2827595 RepID=A0A8S5LL02_9CAUD|nr:MAG TPA: hypothetical protein [Siphoviridae sp. ctvod4]
MFKLLLLVLSLRCKDTTSVLITQVFYLSFSFYFV